MVTQLMPWNGHLVASVANDWLMSAHISVVSHIFDVQMRTTTITAVDKNFVAFRLYVSLHFFKSEVDPLATVKATESRVIEYLLRQEVDITWLA